MAWEARVTMERGDEPLGRRANGGDEPLRRRANGGDEPLGRRADGAARPTYPGAVVASLPPPAPARGAGWYRGDLHVHTVHSDGQYEVSQLVAAAHASGLDFIVSTDHNTCSANRAWPAHRADARVVIAGCSTARGAARAAAHRIPGLGGG